MTNFTLVFIFGQADTSHTLVFICKYEYMGEPYLGALDILETIWLKTTYKVLKSKKSYKIF